MRMKRRWTAAVVVVAALGLWTVSPLIGTSAPSKAQLEKKIGQTQAKIQYRKGIERVLTRDIATYTSRVKTLDRRVQSLTARQASLQGDLDARRAALQRTQSELRAERARLTRLRKRLNEVRTTLASRLVEQYKSGRPDLATIILDADGLEAVLERGSYLQRLAAQDRKILAIVGTARADARATERKLDRLERSQEAIAERVTARRDQIAGLRRNVAGAESSARQAREAKRTLLSQVKERRADLEEDLDAMRAQQAKISGALTAPGAAPIKKGSGQLIYPINGTFTSSFGPRWGRLHAGIDVAIPIGTPLRAADGGRVAIAGPVSGYGNYTCIQHSASMSTCYAHQDSIGVSVGQTVTQGQIIGRTGNTGRSTGPHLHFEVRINGTPVNPMNYL